MIKRASSTGSHNKDYTRGELRALSIRNLVNICKVKAIPAPIINNRPKTPPRGQRNYRGTKYKFYLIDIILKNQNK